MAASIWWNMKIGIYYDSVSGCYPNKNSENIKSELIKMWIDNQDIKNLKYPFK